MISRRTEMLIYRPLTFPLFKYLMTPANYDPVSDTLVRSKWIPPLIDYWMYFVGNIIARFILIGILIESIWAGHARRVTDIIIVSFMFPLFLISAAFAINCLVHYNSSLQLINKILRIHKDLGELNYKGFVIRLS